MNTYIPQAGTIPAKVIAALSLLEPDTELPSSAVLDAIGQPADWHGLSACMKIAVDSGAIEKRSDGRISFWKLPDQQGQQRKQQQVDTKAPPAEILLSQVVPERQPKTDEVSLDLTAVDPVADTEAEAVRAITVQPQGAPAAGAGTLPVSGGTVPMTDEFECALTSANRLVMRIDGLDITLCPQRTRMLFGYLDRVRPPECEGTAA